MSNTRVKCHPTLGILVGTDGHVMVPQSGKHPAHWTFGTKNNLGYRKVMVAGKDYYVHRLVVEAFLQFPIPDGMEVDHINRNRSDNRAFENLRIVSHSDNLRNTPANDRVEARGGIHWYEGVRQYKRERHACYKAEHPEKIREQNARYRAENPEKVRETNARYYQAKRKTHKYMQFADGRKRWVPNEEAEALLKIPLRNRHFLVP